MNKSKALPLGITESNESRLFVYFLIFMTLASFSILLNVPNFYADDSYFYLEIGKNIAGGRGVTFDGLYQTNGFHPLWGLVVSMLQAVSWGQSSTFILVASVYLILSLFSALLILSIARSFHASAIVTYFSVLPLLTLLTATGSVGSEAALSAFAISLLLYIALKFYETPNIGFAVAVGVLATTAFLARLDNIFLIAALGSFLIPHLHYRLSLVAFGSALLTVFPYIAWNLMTFGHLLPISGSLKSSFPHLDFAYLGHVNEIHAVFVAIIIIEVLFLLVTRGRYRTIALFLGIGATLQFLYHFLFQVSATYYWYSVMPGIVLGLITILCVDRIAEIFVDKMKSLSKIFSVVISVAFLFILVINFHKSFYESRPKQDGIASSLWEKVPEGEAMLVGDMQGRIQFYGKGPVLCLNGLTDNWQFWREIKEKDVEEYLQENSIKWLVQEKGDPNMNCSDLPRRDDFVTGCKLYYGLSQKKPLQGRLKLTDDDKIADVGGGYVLWKID